MKYLILSYISVLCFNGYGETEPDSLAYYLENSKAFYKVRDYKNVKHELSKSFKYQSTVNITYNFGREYLLLGQNYKSLGVYDTAIVYFDLALELLNSKYEIQEIAETHLEKGRIYRSTAKYSKAFNSFHTSLELFKSVNDSSRIGKLKLNIGNVFNDLNRFDNAIANYNEAISIYKLINEEDGLAGCYNNLGNIYTYNEEFDSALVYLYKALQVRVGNGNDHQISYIYQNLSSVYLQQNKFDSALVYIEKSIDINNAFPSSYELHLDYYFLGEIYKAKGNFKKAIKYYNKTYDWAILNNSIHTLKDICLSIGISLYDEGKRAESAYYFNQYRLYHDTINVDNPKIEDEFVNYEIVKDSMRTKELILEKDISKIEHSNLELKKTIEINNTKYLWLFVGLGGLSVTLILFSFRKRLRQANLHKRILEDQNEELKRTLISKEEKETLLKEVHHRVKNNLQIVNSLIRLQSHYTSSENYQLRIRETENRIGSMALIHEKLYKSGNLSKLDAKLYIKDLIVNVLDSYQPITEIGFQLDISEVSLSIDTLIPLGLIVNEIISNSIKYAFTNRSEGDIIIKLTDDFKHFTISDNGVGTDLDYAELSENSLGMELIETLCDQLDGKLKFEGVGGFKYSFVFAKLA